MIQAVVPIRTYGEINESLPLYRCWPDLAQRGCELFPDSNHACSRHLPGTCKVSDRGLCCHPNKHAAGRCPYLLSPVLCGVWKLFCSLSSWRLLWTRVTKEASVSRWVLLGTAWRGEGGRLVPRGVGTWLVR